MLKCGMAILALAVLGPLQVTLDSGPATQFRTKAAQALLAYLVVETRSPLSRNYLSELLWPGMPPASARRNLRQTLYEIRQLTPDISALSGGETVPLLLADRQTVQLNPAAQIVVDIDDFEQELEQGTDSSLLEAEKLYRAEFLAGFYLPDNNTYESWLLEKRAEYQRKLLDALGRLADSSLQKGNYERTETYARKQLLHDDLREPAIRQLITALAQQGQRARALSEYDQYRERLDRELSVDPDPELEELAAAVREGSLDDYLGTIPPKVAGDQDLVNQRALIHDRDGIEASRKQVPTNLPVPATPFIGRRNELAQLKELLQEGSSTRLVTLLGPGGSGKTRLAIEAAAEAAVQETSYDDGVWFVSLAKLTEARSIVTELASILRFSFTGQDLSAKQQLMDYLCQKRLLLVFDNYEHLLEPGTPPLAADILLAAANVKILVTSRTRLNVQGETLLPITGLSIVEVADPQIDGDQQHSDAVQLFVDSACRIRPEFDLTLENLESVKRICELVEGSPLAVELAAAWIELLSPGEIAREIEENLDFLEIEWQDVPERQRSLRAVFNGSWKLLPESEQEGIKRLTLFQGSFSHEAAAAVAGASLKLLLNLANRSWLIRDGSGRYHIHSLLRHFANDKLRQDTESWRTASDAQSEYYCSLVDRLSVEMRGFDQNLAFDTVEAEFENIRLVWYRLLDGGRLTKLVNLLLPGLFFYCSARSRGEDLLTLVRDAQKPLEGSEKGSPSGRTLAILTTAEVAFVPFQAVMSVFAFFASWVFDNDKVELTWQEFGLGDNGDVAPLWQIVSATLYGWQVDRESAASRLRELIEKYLKRQDRWATAYAMQNLAHLLTQKRSIEQRGSSSSADIDLEEDLAGVYYQHPDWKEGRHLISQAERLFDEIGDHLEMANTLRLSGLLKMGIDPEGASKDFEAAIEIMKKEGNLSSAAFVIWNLAEATIMQGIKDRGISYLDEVIAIHEVLGNRHMLAASYSYKSITLLRFDGTAKAREVRNQSLNLAHQTKDDQLIAWNLWEMGDIDRVAGKYHSARVHYEKSRDIFQRINSSLGLAFYYRGIGDLELAAGDPSAALKSFQHSLDLARSNHYWSVVQALAGRGRAFYALGEYQSAEGEFLRALKLAREITHIDLTMVVLSGICKLLLALGQPKEAVALGAFVLQQNMTWVEIRQQVTETVHLASEELSNDEILAAKERGRMASREAIVALYLGEMTLDGWQQAAVHR